MPQSSGGGAEGCGSESGTNLSDGILDAVVEQLRIEPEHAVPEPLQHAITTRIGCARRT
jgi:hypothetical protein